MEELLQLKKSYKKLFKEKRAQQIEWEKLIKAVRGKDMKSIWESITLTTNRGEFNFSMLLKLAR